LITLDSSDRNDEEDRNEERKRKDRWKVGSGDIYTILGTGVAELSEWVHRRSLRQQTGPRLAAMLNMTATVTVPQ
jgi:hypothetical protein